jgi:16S rRNA (uracil1498-N3)-methyltransferase
MALPFFYIADYNDSQKEIVLDEETSKHVIQVLRMKTHQQLQLTDGKGKLLTATIIDDHKKHCSVTVDEIKFIPPSARKVTLAVSLIKNANRFEWLLEKATEIGISSIIPLICGRTEKEKFRSDRLHGIVISAMLQSQQCWLPELTEPTPVEEVITKAKQDQKFIAHCVNEQKRNLADLVNETLSSQLILIGPEGDFTPQEIQLAIEHRFSPVTLGATRLRTETAGIVAATLLKII